MKRETPFKGKIEQYLLGRLPRDEYLEMERAIKEQPDLAREVELRRLEFDTAEELIAQDIRALFQQLREKEIEEGQKPEPSEKTFGSRRLWYYLAAAAVLLPLAFFLYRALFPIEPPPLIVSVASTQISHDGGSDGSITLTVSGGTPDYTYIWTNDQRSKDLSGLSAGTYRVTVTDANGRTVSATATVTELPLVAVVPGDTSEEDEIYGAPSQGNTPKLSTPDKKYSKLIAAAEGAYNKSQWNSLSTGLRTGDPTQRNPTALAAEAIERRDYPGAIQHLQNTGKENTQAQLLKAHAYFREDRFKDAANAARTAAELKKPPYREEAEWMLVLSLVADGKTDDDFHSISEKIMNDAGHQYHKDMTALRDKLSEK